jgi:hypothetical protein
MICSLISQFETIDVNPVSPATTEVTLRTPLYIHAMPASIMGARSALGHLQTSAHVRVMSALSPKADIG